ncbi:GNAT family N-acetyltransferase [Paenibacillus yanchengensis]|uniref:GNAT family N-acetyltransferase n=1 Tax=Paenibacillus yanchengensis TaxID=2035833 RepID=A0ABW4YPX3_9BACL
MYKELYLMVDHIPQKMLIRNYTIADFEQLIEVQKLAFPPPFAADLWWTKEQIIEHVKRFSTGAICAEVNGEIIGSMTGLIIDSKQYGEQHQWSQVTDNGYIRNHNPFGDTLYVVDICVVPVYRKWGVGKWLMQSMYETVVQMRLSRLLGGGRMPGYAAKYEQFSIPPQKYVENVLSGEWTDPVISFMLRCGRMPVAIAENYLDDEESRHHAVIMEWRNPFM